MAIKATFLAGEDTITTKTKLHQWDYGQTLEIEAMDLSPIVEVHFACPGMSEADVRPCTTTNGVTTVSIPDRCLEQSSNITAWVFEINGTQGMTTKTITIPVIARTKPSNNGAVPEEFVDCYTELISEVNEAIKVLTEGNVTAKYAQSAGNATSANTAGHANTAGAAETAKTASSLLLEGCQFGRRLLWSGSLSISNNKFYQLPFEPSKANFLVFEFNLWEKSDSPPYKMRSVPTKPDFSVAPVANLYFVRIPFTNLYEVGLMDIGMKDGDGTSNNLTFSLTDMENDVLGFKKMELVAIYEEL